MSNALMKLGKLPAKKDKRALKLVDYIDPDVMPTPPPACNWSKVVGSYGMMLNDQIGDCAVAGPGHLIQTWSANIGQTQLVTDDEILQAYEEISGYRPSDPDTDSGCVMVDVMNYWRQTGIGNHKIGPFIEVNPKNSNEVELAIYLFGGINTGFQLPVSCQSQDVWSVVGDGQSGNSQPGSWGGHCVPIIGYDDVNPVCITWGKRLSMTWGFLQNYCDEAFAIISNDWFLNRKAPNGFDIDQLTKDLAAIK